MIVSSAPSPQILLNTKGSSLTREESLLGIRTGPAWFSYHFLLCPDSPWTNFEVDHSGITGPWRLNCLNANPKTGPRMAESGG
jgi:hypothetical protein